MRARMQPGVLCVMVGGLLMAGQNARAQDQGNTIAPQVFDSSKVKIEIVGALFVKELKGVNASFNQARTDMYRGLVLMLKITKPAGEALTVNAQDMVLHYRYGTRSDVAKCSGVSTFSVDESVDRPMNLFSMGLGGATTGVPTAKASVAYIDLFFQNMEPDTADVHLLVAQPIGVSFKTNGWR